MSTHVIGSLMLSTSYETDEEETSYDSRKKFTKSLDDHIESYLSKVVLQDSEDNRLLYNLKSYIKKNEVKSIISLSGDFSSTAKIPVITSTVITYLETNLSYNALADELNAELINGSLEVEVDNEVDVIAYDPEDSTWKSGKVNSLSTELNDTSLEKNPYIGKSVIMKYLDDNHLSLDKGGLPNNIVLTLIYTSLVSLYTDKDMKVNLGNLRDDLDIAINLLLRSDY